MLNESDHTIYSVTDDMLFQLGLNDERPIEEHCVPEDLHILKAMINGSLRGWQHIRMKKGDDEEPIFCMLRYLGTENGEKMCFNCIFDTEAVKALPTITEVLEMKSRILKREKFLSFYYIPSQGLCRLLSVPVGLHIQREPDELVTPETLTGVLLMHGRTEETVVQAVVEYMKHVREDNGRFSIKINADLLDTGSQSCQLWCETMRHRSGMETRLCVIRPEASSENVILKGRDSLTGLLLKEEITKYVKESLQSGSRENCFLGIIDIDYFKDINDNYGHSIGDEVIRRMGGFLESTLGQYGVIGRIGGDEFMMFLTGIRNEEMLRKCLREIKNLACTVMPEVHGRGGAPLSLSIGAAPCKPELSYEEIFKIADFCLYRAKEKGRNRYVFYNPEIHGRVEDMLIEKKENAILDSRQRSLGDGTTELIHASLRQDPPSADLLLSAFVTLCQVSAGAVYRETENGYELVSASDGKDTQKTREHLEVFRDTVGKAFTSLNASNNVFKMDDVKWNGTFSEETRQKLIKEGISSFILVRQEMNGKALILGLCVVGRVNVWNPEHEKYYQSFLLAMHTLLKNTDKESKRA